MTAHAILKVSAAHSSVAAIGEVTDQFRAALIDRGILPPAELRADGQIHRCDVDGGSRGRGDGAYILHLDEHPAGGFENWRDGLGWQRWKARLDRRFKPIERATYRARVDEASRERQIEGIQRKAEARRRAAKIWAASKLAEHPYLARKGIEPLGTRVLGNQLLVPVRDVTGTLHSLQFIGESGEKRFLRGGRVDGCYFSVGSTPRDVLCIAEGFATGASIHQVTQYPVAVAFNAGNLISVARALRDKLPTIRLIICGDDDRDTEGNPGRAKANAAARAASGLVALPAFGEVTI
jgi:putative DNA primase/helicase